MLLQIFEKPSNKWVNLRNVNTTLELVKIITRFGYDIDKLKMEIPHVLNKEDSFDYYGWVTFVNMDDDVLVACVYDDEFHHTDSCNVEEEYKDWRDLPDYES